MSRQVMCSGTVSVKSDGTTKCGAAVVKVPEAVGSSRRRNCGIFVPQAFFMAGRLGLLACQPAKGWRWGARRESLGPCLACLSTVGLLRLLPPSRSLPALPLRAKDLTELGCWRPPGRQPCSGVLCERRGHEGIQMYLRRHRGSLTAAAGSIQVPCCIPRLGVWMVAAGNFFGRLGKENSLLVRAPWLCGSVSWWSCGVLAGGNGQSYVSLITSSAFYNYSSPENNGSECTRHGHFLS